MQDFNESAWHRGWRDTKNIWTNWIFFVLSGVVAVAVGGLVAWHWGLIIVIIGMLFAWVYATERAIMLQRNEARHRVTELEAEKEQTLLSKNLQTELSQLIIEGSKVRKGFMAVQTLGDVMPTDEFTVWRENVAAFLKRNDLISEHALWIKDLGIDIDESLLRDFKFACNAGLQRLEDISKQLQ